MNEIYLPINGYENKYLVSSFGYIKSPEKISIQEYEGRRAIRTLREKVLKPMKDKQGYCYVRLYKDGVWKDFSVHRLVASHFIPNPNNKSEVNHKNGDKADNCVDNLEWVTPSENQHDDHVKGRRNHNGENHPSKRLTNEQALDMRSLYEQGNSVQEIHNKYPQFPKRTIQKILDMKSRTHIKI